jgi:acetylglutamate kinase
MIDALCDKPLINMESAMNHPCQALADWRTLDELNIPQHAKFVLSWVYHPKALPLAVPAATVHMAAMRGMEVVVLRPEGFALPPQIMENARFAAAAAGGSLTETSDRAAALAGASVLYAKEWGTTLYYGDTEADLRLRSDLSDWCVRERGSPGALPDAKLMHCLPVRRNVAVADEVLDGPARGGQTRGLQSSGGADGRSASHAGLSGRFSEYLQMIMSRPDPSVAVRALKSAAPYIRMYKNKVFVIKAGGAVFSDEISTRALIEQVAILHQVGIKTVLVHGGGPQLDSLQASLGHRYPHGQWPAGHGSEVHRRDRHGAERPDQHANPRDLPRARHRGHRLERRRCRLDTRAQASTGARRRRLRRDRGLWLRGQYRFGKCRRDREAARERLDAGGQPLSADSHGTLLNINADTVAAAIGGALSAEKLVLCTGAQGILERVDDPSSVVSYTDIKGLKRLRDQGSLKDGMLPKAAAIENAIRGGVRRVHVISYKSPDSLLAEIFTNEGTGTLVVADLTALSPRRSN